MVVSCLSSHTFSSLFSWLYFKSIFVYTFSSKILKIRIKYRKATGEYIPQGLFIFNSSIQLSKGVYFLSSWHMFSLCLPKEILHQEPKLYLGMSDTWHVWYVHQQSDSTYLLTCQISLLPSGHFPDWYKHPKSLGQALQPGSIFKVLSISTKVLSMIPEVSFCLCIYTWFIFKACQT